MPNYVTSRCAVHGPAEDVAAFRRMTIVKAPDDHSDVGGEIFDFRSIIPMPAVVAEAESSSEAEVGMALIGYRDAPGDAFADLGQHWSARVRNDVAMPDGDIADVAAAYLSKHPSYETQGVKRIAAIAETGHPSWYEWSIENWGTKWDAFRYEQVDDDPFTFRFETAWSFPTPIFEKLAALYPTLTFECWTHDEGDCFGGRGCFNPREGDEPFAFGPGDDEAYELAHGYAREKYDDEEDED